MEAFAKALTQIPLIIAENAGLDSQDLLGRLKAEHKGKGESGLNVNGVGSVVSMREHGIIESYRSKFSSLCAAAEAAEQIIRVDDIIHNAPRQREGM